MTFNKFFLFYFSLIFNIFSNEIVKFIVKVQDVVDDKDLNDIFSKEILIEKNKLNKDYKCEEIIELLGIYNDEELKKYNISNLNYVFKFIKGFFLYFKGETINIKCFSTEAEKVIYFRPKNKYIFDILDRYIMKEDFTLKNEDNKKLTKDKFIKRYIFVQNTLKSDNCCFLLTEELYIWLRNILNKEGYEEINGCFFVKDSKVFYPLDISTIDIDNHKYKLEDFYVTKNLYFLVKELLNYLYIKHPVREKVEYKDFKYINYNGKEVFNFEQELENNTLSQIDDKLKNIKLNTDSKIEVFIKSKFTEEKKDKFTEEKKRKLENKLLKCCQRVKC